MRISDWSSDVCSSDLFRTNQATLLEPDTQATQSSPEVGNKGVTSTRCRFVTTPGKVVTITAVAAPGARDAASIDVAITGCKFLKALEIFVQPAAILNPVVIRSEEHTSELQSLMRNSYAVFCLKKKKKNKKK